MNTNPKAIRILCFGDSNTWGRIPGDNNKARFPSNIRWTGVLQNKLGNKYEIIEEGLNGRTTTRNSPFKSGKNGLEYLFPSLESQNPIDIVILALGKNELKKQYEATVEEIGIGIKKCIKAIKTEGLSNKEASPQVILIAPAIIIEKERFRFDKIINDFEGGHGKSKKLPSLYKKIAEEESIHFIDLNKIVEVGNDGIHLDSIAHNKIGVHLSDYIKQEVSI